MIAAALQRTFPDRKISVSVDRIQMEEPSGQRVFALTPFSVSAKIIAFDWWKRVNPFSFDAHFWPESA